MFSAWTAITSRLPSAAAAAAAACSRSRRSTGAAHSGSGGCSKPNAHTAVRRRWLAGGKIMAWAANTNHGVGGRLTRWLGGQ